MQDLYRICIYTFPNLLLNLAHTGNWS